MRAGEANLTASTNAYDQRTITLPGFTSASGVTARVEFRASDDDASTLYLTLTSSAGLTLTSDGSNLLIAWEITEAQMDTLAAALKTAGRSKCAWSLKITPANSKTQQWLKGSYTLDMTATA